jgi:hypothetical protein
MCPPQSPNCKARRLPEVVAGSPVNLKFGAREKLDSGAPKCRGDQYHRRTRNGAPYLTPGTWSSRVIALNRCELIEVYMVGHPEMGCPARAILPNVWTDTNPSPPRARPGVWDNVMPTSSTDLCLMCEARLCPYPPQAAQSPTVGIRPQPKG